MSNYYDPGTGDHVLVDGMIVERDALMIAEAIRDYDENLVVLCVDPNHVSGISEEPFVIAERDDAGVLHPVLRAWTLDQSVLDRIWLADNKKFNTIDTLIDIGATSRRMKPRADTKNFEKKRKILLPMLLVLGLSTAVRDSNTGDLITFYDDRPATRK